MTWTYSPAQLATQPIYQVRRLIGDVTKTDPQLQDEEIGFFLTLRNSVYGAAAEACRSLAAHMAREADSVQGDLHTLYSSKTRAYRAMAATFENYAVARSGALPYAGGISIADKTQAEQDTDRVQPQFQLDMDDNALPVGQAGNESEEVVGP